MSLSIVVVSLRVLLRQGQMILKVRAQLDSSHLKLWQIILLMGVLLYLGLALARHSARGITT